MELTTHAGRNSPLSLRVLKTDPLAATVDEPINGAAVTRTVLALDPGQGALVLVDSDVPGDAGVFDWSAGNGVVMIDLRATAQTIPAGTQGATLVVFAADNPQGAVVAEFTHHRVPDVLA